MKIYDMMKSSDKEMRYLALQLYKNDNSLMTLDEAIDILQWLNAKVRRGLQWKYPSYDKLRKELIDILWDVECDAETKRKICAAILDVPVKNFGDDKENDLW